MTDSTGTANALVPPSLIVHSVVYGDPEARELIEAIGASRAEALRELMVPFKQSRPDR